MGIDETWAISADRIALFFAQQPDVVRTPEGFAFRDCRIRLTPVSRKVLGQWTLPSTRVELSGSREDVDAIHRRFFLRFLSAGG